MSKAWWQRQEKGGTALLRLTLFLISVLPNFLLTPVIFVVSAVYYAVCKHERENVKFYLSLLRARGVATKSAFWNFYNFAVSICDKMRVWSGKISSNDVKILELDTIKKELCGKRGHIFIVSHFGNIDIARAISNELDWLDIHVLMYVRHSSQFIKILNQISKFPLKILQIGELGVGEMLQIKEIIDRGGHIGVMGDRVPVSGDKSVRLSLLGRECELPVGGFMLAGLLKCDVSTFWVVKTPSGYELSFKNLAKNLTLGRDKLASTTQFAKLYAHELESMCERYPHMWFNFFDFWSRESVQKEPDDRI